VPSAGSIERSSMMVSGAGSGPLAMTRARFAGALRVEIAGEPADAVRDGALDARGRDHLAVEQDGDGAAAVVRA
jgi:hypothetical protein